MHSPAHETNHSKLKEKQGLSLFFFFLIKAKTVKKEEKRKKKVHRTQCKQTKRVTELHWNRDKSSGKHMH